MRCKGASHQRLRHCAFSREEDDNLRSLVAQYGTSDSWPQIAEHMKRRSAKQCRERWNVLTLRENSRREFTPEEDRLLISKCVELGPKWPILQTFFHERNIACLKNRWKMLRQKAETDAAQPVIARQPPAPAPADDFWSHVWPENGREVGDLFSIAEDDELWDFMNFESIYQF